LARLALASEDGRASALRDLKANLYAASSTGPRDSLWSTWLYFAGQWGIPPLPVVADTVLKMAAALRAGSYRSPEQYFSRARQEHSARMGYEIPADVERLIRSCTRSVLRGSGPAAFKDSFVFEDLAKVACLPSLTDLPSRGPGAVASPSVEVIAPFALGVLGGWLLARGIECSFAEVQDVTFDHGKSEVSWALPVSKTDPRALGTLRTHGCLCGGASGCLERVCPYHFAKAYVGLLVSYFGPGVLDADRHCPLSPTPAGGVISKAAAVRAIVFVATATGLAPTRPDALGVERPRFGGHTLRVAGAQALARAGVETYLIEIIGRWGSSAIK